MKFVVLSILLASSVFSQIIVYARECDAIFPGISTFGFTCNYQCHCVDDRPCNALGQCSDGCSYGWMGPGCQYRNVATDFKTAKQVGPNANVYQQPQNAVDGRHHTCSETSTANHVGEHSWSIELRHDYKVVGLVLHVPENSVEVFREFRIETGPSKSYFPDLCYEHPNVSGTSVMEIMCLKPATGKNLRITLRLEDVPLRLCEVEIYGGRQVSFNMPTKQSTSISAMPSWKAVDGHFVTADDVVEDMEASTCSATNGNENNPWWYVDLQHQYSVQGVDFYGRFSSANQSKGFHISIGSSPNMTRDVFMDVPPDLSVGDAYQPRKVTFTPPSEVQILKVDLRPFNTTAQLSICELYIFADCQKNKCGWDCVKDCFCSNEITGNWKINGTCPYGCAGRWTGVNGACDTECSNTSWGERCQHTCGNCLDSSCDVDTGKCRRGCRGHWVPPLCTEVCSNGSFGVNCTNQCGHCLNGAPCDKANGICQQGCDPGWQGLLCDRHCPEGQFGSNCSSQCGRCKDSQSCDPVSGVCTTGCYRGFIGQLCDTDLNLLSRIKNETTLRMSSVHSNWNAVRIIDGLFVDNPESCKCCAGTQNDALSWLEIDLGNMYPISSVNVYGSITEKVFEHLTGFNLYLTNETTDTNEPVYSNSILKGDIVQIHFPNILTRFLKFERPGKLTICEVQIIEGECQIGYFGTECSKQCHCADGRSCDRQIGTCVAQICDLGFTGPSCSEECLASSFGQDCSRQCHCIGGQACSKDHGICPMGCADGYDGDHCQNACRAGRFGKNCENGCGHCLHSKPCNHVTGKCAEGCHPEYFGPLCKHQMNLIQRIKADTTTEMSSTYNDWSSEKAIDNDIGPDPLQCKCCSSTLNEALSWWRIDFGMMYPLSRVEVFGRLNESDFQQTNGLEITLKNTSNEQGFLAFVDKGTDVKTDFNITVPNYLARIVEIRRAGKLTICELKAYEGECPLGQYGNSCGQFCHCADGKACDRNDGRCSTPACIAGWTGQACAEACEKGFYGQNCSMLCGFCKDSETCNHKNGMCHNGCANGYSGLFCSTKASCPGGYYGKHCASKCGTCKDLETCHSETGFCKSGCASGYTGLRCNSKCENGHFGLNCIRKCGHCKNDENCNFESGECPNGCAKGYIGIFCSEGDEGKNDVSNSAAVGSNNIQIEDGTSGGMIALYTILSMIAGIGGGVTIYCRCRNRNNDNDNGNDGDYANIYDVPRPPKPEVTTGACIELKHCGSNNKITNNIYTSYPKK